MEKIKNFAPSTMSIYFEKADGSLVWGKIVGKNANTIFDMTKKNYKVGDECQIKYFEKNGQCLVSAIFKPDFKMKEEAPRKEEFNQSQPVEPKQVDNIQSFVYPDRYMSPKTPEESKQIRSLALTNSTAQIVSGMLIGLQGQINPNNVVELTTTFIDSVYDKLNKKGE